MRPKLLQKTVADLLEELAMRVELGTVEHSIGVGRLLLQVSDDLLSPDEKAALRVEMMSR